jgi:hypothetical protein
MAVWMAYAALAAYQAGSGLRQAQAIRDQADLTRKLNEVNARYAEYDAYNADLNGYAEAAAYQPKIDETVNQQKVAFQAQNVDTTFGTAAEVQKETRSIGLLNQLEMENQARAKARGFLREAERIRNSSNMQSAESDMRANSASISGYAGAFSTGVSAYEKSPFGEQQSPKRPRY